jgi:hypothetical protein
MSALPGLITIAVSPGELLDRLTILAIKRRRIGAPEKLRHVEREWTQLDALRREQVPMDAPVAEWMAALEAVHQTLWDIEEAIRGHEQRQDFGADFIDLARQVYLNNDQRTRLKQRIDTHLHSPWKEQKSYFG